MIDRILAQRIVNQSKSVLLIGPRQTGKSTMLHSMKPDLVVDLSSEREFFQYSSDAGYLDSILEVSKAKLVFIDEIQRLPSLLNTVQHFIDKSKRISKPIKFLISGSSARKLKRGDANLLPGRIFSYETSGFAAQELNYELNIKKAMSYGFLPEPYLEKKENISSEILKNYSATYLKEEIQAEALTRNIQGFARFLNVLAESFSSIIDFSKLSSKAKVSRSMAIRFVEILEDTLVAQRVNSFKEALGADVIHHPKLYFFDPGVLNGLLNNFNVSADRMGPIFENTVYAQLRNSFLANNIDYEMYFFRTRNGSEVDFIVRFNKKVWAIECKGGQVRADDLNGLKSFKKYYPQVDQCVVVSPFERKRSLEKTLVCNLNELIREMNL